MMKSLIAGLLVGLLFIAAGSSARASGNSDVSSLIVNADLQTDGTVKVTQHLDYIVPASLNWQLFTNVRNLQVAVDGHDLTSKDWRAKRSGSEINLTSTQLGGSWVISYSASTTLIRQQDRDQIFLKVFQQPGVSLDNIQVIFNLPSDVDQKLLNGNVYTIDGAAPAVTNVTSGRTIEYSSEFAGPLTVFTVSADWPKSVLNLSAWQELRLNLLNLDSLPWFILGLLLPLFSLIVIITLLYRERRTEKRVTVISTQPPALLSPILVGVLVNKKVYPEEIVALLIDLCQRGYLVIVKKSHEYYLSQRQVADEHLQEWEREILDQLFPSFGVKISESNLRALSGQSLFSPSVKNAFSQIYQVITQLNFFQENPHLTRVRYKLLAMSFYFVAVIGVIYVIASSATPYLLIPFIGTLVMAYVIIRLSPKLIHYTTLGEQTREKWLAFANYLKSAEPLRFEAAQNHYFEKNLAWAIALHQTRAWAKRFDRSSTAIVKPDWFVTYEDMTAQEFADELVRFTKIISEELTKLRGPLVN